MAKLDNRRDIINPSNEQGVKLCLIREKADWEM